MEQDIAKKYNRRIFPVYKALAWDALFLYVIIFLFLTEVKGLSAAEVMYAVAAYTAFLLLFQIPGAILIRRIGDRKALILGDLLVATSIILLIVANSLLVLIFIYFIWAVGDALKGIATHTLLYDSVKSKKGKHSYANIDAKGAAGYYIVDGITAIFTGFLFVINNYLPIILAASTSVLAILIACRFEDVKKEETEEITISTSIRNIKQGLAHSFRSRRLRGLFLFMAMFGGTLLMITTYQRSLLVDLQVRPEYMGIIFAGLTIISGFSAIYQDKIHNAFRNKTLGAISIPAFLSFIVVGIVTTMAINHFATVMIVVLCFAVHHFSRGMYWTLSRKYITNFTNSDVRTSILGAGELIEGIGGSIIMLLAGLLLDFYYTNVGYLIVGIVGMAIILLVLSFMKKRVGLSPEQYGEEDLNYEEK